MKLTEFKGEIEIRGASVSVAFKEGALTLVGLTALDADWVLKSISDGATPVANTTAPAPEKVEPKVYLGEPVKPKPEKKPRAAKDPPAQTEIPGTEVAPPAETRAVEPTPEPEPPEPKVATATEVATSIAPPAQAPKKADDVMQTAPPKSDSGLPEALTKAMRLRDVIEYFAANGCTTAEEVLEKCLAHKDAVPALQRIESLDIDRVGRAFNMIAATSKVA